MASSAGEKVLLKALYTFKGQNNDELNFKKGAEITLTQKEDGGWWEGTLDGRTGWFPSNYVKEISRENQNPQQQNQPTKRADYRKQVVRDLVTKEKEFVAELRAFHKNYIGPLHRAEILRENVFRQLVGNMDELTEVHCAMNVELEECASKTGPREQRIGRIFLHHGAAIRSAHQTYWSNHPKAVAVLEQYSAALDAFMLEKGAPAPGLMVLTTVLSKPLRHLEKYAGLAQELEQYLEDDHPDRGDTQRSIGFFKSVASECAKLRRQRELELEVLTGTIRGWEGDRGIAALGEIAHMGSVAVGREHGDRYLVLFHTHLVILSVSARMSAFVYEGKLPLSGIAVNRLEDTEDTLNSFEITGPMIDRILVICQSKPESLKWVEILQQAIKQSRQQQQHGSNHNSRGSGGAPNNSSSNNNVVSSPGLHQHGLRPHNVGGHKGYLWKMSCLRPAPPTRSFIGVDDKKKKDPDTTYEEDMQILRVIEAYCTSSKRQTQAVSAVIDHSPASPVLLEEKIITEEISRGSLQERSVVDTVYSIRDQVMRLGHQSKEMLRMLEEEIAARKRLESVVKTHAQILQHQQQQQPQHNNSHDSRGSLGK